jgi:hypothetical protein
MRADRNSRYSPQRTRRGIEMKSALRLLILMAVTVTVAGLLGGWKWDKPTPSGGTAATVYAAVTG